MWNDQTFFTATVNTIQEILKSRGFWEDLERAKDEYALVVSNLRQMGLPTVFAAIPYQETRYRPHLISPVCAAGIWQFMPETVFSHESSRRKMHHHWAVKTVDTSQKKHHHIACLEMLYITIRILKAVIKSCRVDKRPDVEASTVAALHLLEDTWEADEAVDSGAAVQMTILSHNAGWDDSPYLAAKNSPTSYPHTDAI